MLSLNLSPLTVFMLRDLKQFVFYTDLKFFVAWFN